MIWDMLFKFTMDDSFLIHQETHQSLTECFKLEGKNVRFTPGIMYEIQLEGLCCTKF